MHMHQLQVQLFFDGMDSDALDAWRGFLTAHAQLTRRISRELNDAGLPDLSWYDLLWALYRQPNRALRVNQLAREVVLSPTAMSRFVDRVEREGYVERDPDPDDRRALQIVITDKGIELLQKMWPIYRSGIEQHFAAHLGPSPASLTRTFRAMAESATRPPGE